MDHGMTDLPGTQVRLLSDKVGEN